MAENLETNEFANQSNCGESSDDFLKRAAEACEAGDLVLGMHLYLAAYEKAVADPEIADGMALAGLHEAWSLACDLKERSMAEYVFEKLEPYLTGEEIAQYAGKLQNLALDRLEQYGFSREELQDMAEMISQDLMDGEGSVLKVESISIPHVVAASSPNGADDWADHADADKPVDETFERQPAAPCEETRSRGADVEEAPSAVSNKEKPEKVMLETVSADFNPYDEYNTSSIGTSYHAATSEGSGAYVFTRDADRAAASEKAREHAAPAQSELAGQPDKAGQPDQTHQTHQPGRAGQSGQPRDDASEQQAEAAKPADEAPAMVGPKSNVVPNPGVSMSKAREELPSMPAVDNVKPNVLNYRSIAGYRGVISVVREMGVGMQRDEGFRNFVKMLNARHGLERMPAVDTLLFRSPVVEDATRFVDATIGEIGLPALRMSMEEGLQGIPMLVVTTVGNSRPRMNHARNQFDGPGILVIDDLDMWVLPQPPENVEGIANFVMANMSRGAREAINLIHSAVQDPDVYVLATASTSGEVDPFFYELLEPITIVDIAFPDEAERGDIWDEIMRAHPSVSGLDRGDLVAYSQGLSRYDLYMAARAAVEEAYKAGLAQRSYVAVSRQNMLDKLAACHPLDSEVYRALENAIVHSFREELDGLEDLIDGPAE